MEYSSILHYMNESFQYKLDEHKYVIKLKTKKDDVKKVTLCYMEKYFKEKNMPGIPSETFYVEMKKVASTQGNDYFEASISDVITLNGVNKKIDEYLSYSTDSRFSEYLNKMRNLEGKSIDMLSAAYYFILENDSEKKYYGNYKFFDEIPNGVIDMYNLVFHTANADYFKVPSWSKGTVVYQIFPERFAPTDDNYSKDWNLVPMEHRTRTNGTLKGIEQKIPYLKELGIDAIYLTPIFYALSNHRYDSIDYMKIDPLLGSEDDFKSLVENLHKAGIKIILDLVFNHSSIKFFAFEDLLKNQENSKYKDWYFIKKFPVELNIPSDYMGFSFSPYMPKLNTSNPECRKYLMDVSRYYLEKFNIDGYRLDVANEVTHDFWIEFRKLCKSINPDCLIMGEIWYESTPFLRGDQFDSIMNYTYFDAIRGILNNRFSIDEFVSIIERERGEASLTYYHNSNLLVGSHDTDRIYHSLNHDINKYKQAMTLLFTLPGSPILYYGDEKMMDGGFDPDCRRGMNHNPDFNKEQLEYVKKLINIKHIDAFKIGDIKINKLRPYFSFVRFDYNSKYEVILNFDNNDIVLEEYKGQFDLLSQDTFDGILKANQSLIIKYE